MIAFTRKEEKERMRQRERERERERERWVEEERNGGERKSRNVKPR